MKNLGIINHKSQKKNHMNTSVCTHTSTQKSRSSRMECTFTCTCVYTCMHATCENSAFILANLAFFFNFKGLCQVHVIVHRASLARLNVFLTLTQPWCLRGLVTKSVTTQSPWRPTWPRPDGGREHLVTMETSLGCYHPPP